MSAGKVLGRLAKRLLEEAGPSVGASLAGIAREEVTARAPKRHRALASAAVDSGAAVLASVLSGGRLELDQAEVAAQVLAELEPAAWKRLEAAVARARELRRASGR